MPICLTNSIRQYVGWISFSVSPVGVCGRTHSIPMNRIQCMPELWIIWRNVSMGKLWKFLRPYEDVNTAIAYMSLGYDKAALRILEQSSQTAETQYMQAILNARLGNEQRAVSLLLSAAEVDDRIRFRANLRSGIISISEEIWLV